MNGPRWYAVAEFRADQRKLTSTEWFVLVYAAARGAQKAWRQDARIYYQPRFYWLAQKDHRLRSWVDQDWQVRITNWDTRPTTTQTGTR